MENEKKKTPDERKDERLLAIKKKMEKLRLASAKIIGSKQKEENKKRKGRIFILGLAYMERFKLLGDEEKQKHKKKMLEQGKNIFQGQERNMARLVDAMEWLLPSSSASESAAPPVAPPPASTPAEPLCPICGLQLERKTRQHDEFKSFLRCSAYPDCRFEQEIDEL